MSPVPNEGRVALVTGGAGGIGAAIVRRLVQSDCSVAFTHLGQAERARELREELTGQGARIRDIESDTADPTAVAELHEALPGLIGGAPTILVCCAGITRDRVCWKQPEADFDAVMGTNLRGSWLQLRACIAGMRAQSHGRVVLVGSINGTRGKRGQTAYAASKAGLIGLARSAAREVGSFGITVNVVEPGWIETPMTRSLPTEIREHALAECLTRRLGKPEDVAYAVDFLCRPEAAQITGQVLRVDGGQSLGA